ncbi:hypothetical protein RCL_jg26823.t1 [Rhizophagus clarus]|uniref:Uncharacterized protein n=1 Tax=Rhizophagus clarus TaxID=94130 RepID=A0A8H3LG10_9GLOM|nr:hypothetical protein RCL_jg26823.t1 [Rhizophagus clarus]
MIFIDCSERRPSEELFMNPNDILDHVAKSVSARFLDSCTYWTLKDFQISCAYWTLKICCFFYLFNFKETFLTFHLSGSLNKQRYNQISKQPEL